MNFQQKIDELKNTPNWCASCNCLTEMMFTVLKTNSKGQWQGLICARCSEQKKQTVRFVPFRSKAQQDYFYR